MLARSGKVNDAVQLLLKNKGNEHNLDRILISGQVLLEKGDVSGAIKILEKLPNDTKYRAGLLSSLVALYLAADMRPKVECPLFYRSTPKYLHLNFKPMFRPMVIQKM